MAGVLPGTQGEVRIWMPDQQQLRTNVLLCGGFILLEILVAALSLYCSMVASGAFLTICSAISFWALACSLRSLRRPCYVTTDNAGMGVVTQTGSHALRWAEIRSLDRSSGVLVIRGSENEIPVDITGYFEEVKDEILQLIVERARLRQQPLDGSLYLRRDEEIRRMLPVPAEQ